MRTHLFLLTCIGNLFYRGIFRQNLLQILFCLFLGAATLPAKQQRLPGDVDGDGRITPIDVSLAMQYGLELRVPPTLEAEVAADMSGNGRIDPVDISLMMQVGLGIRPQAVIHAAQLNTNLPLQFQFSCTVTGGTPGYSYSWDFNGDGQQESPNAAPIGTFPTEGVFEVSCRVTDAAGNATRARYDLRADVTPPAAPPSVTLTPGNGTCLLEWESPESALSLGYNIYRQKAGESAFSKINSHLASASWLDDYLENGVSYSYCLRTVDWAGNEGPPSSVLAGVPGTPPAKPVIITRIERFRRNYYGESSRSMPVNTGETAL